MGGLEELAAAAAVPYTHELMSWVKALKEGVSGEGVGVDAPSAAGDSPRMDAVSTPLPPSLILAVGGLCAKGKGGEAGALLARSVKEWSKKETSPLPPHPSVASTAASLLHSAGEVRGGVEVLRASASAWGSVVGEGGGG